MGEILTRLHETTVAGLPLDRLILSFLVILFSLILKRVIGGLVLRRLAKLAVRTRSRLDDLLCEAVRRPLEAMIVLIGLWIAIGLLALPSEPANLRRFAHVAMLVALTCVIAWLLFRLVDAFGSFFERVAAETDSKIDDALVPLFRKALKVFISVIGIVVIIQNLGYSISGILAGLGIGGLALALAAKDTLANVFGAIAILFDRPFAVGDWVRGPDFEGVIENVGFRSTRIRTFPKTLVTVPNSQLVNMVVDNQQQMPIRRMDVEVGVTYATSATQMRQALAELERIVCSTEGIVEEGIALRFVDFGASSLVIRIRCFTSETGYDAHSLVRQELLLRIMDKLEELGLEIAFPSQTVYFGEGSPLALRRSAQPDG
ncbi:MAG: mechanosensitive ion channel [Candidatus Eisenbacteria bacterium]|nr:mechanosensitive ion channel [Candidatus Eisenbacteria bacterium]